MYPCSSTTTHSMSEAHEIEVGLSPASTPSVATQLPFVLGSDVITFPLMSTAAHRFASGHDTLTKSLPLSAAADVQVVPFHVSALPVESTTTQTVADPHETAVRSAPGLGST